MLADRAAAGNESRRSDSWAATADGIRSKALCRWRFPDCVAVREMAKGQWQDQNVEVEFESKNFLRHGHDPKKCDAIVWLGTQLAGMGDTLVRIWARALAGP